MVIFQILAVYHQSRNDLSSASTFYDKAIHQCMAMGDWQLLIIPSTKGETRETINEVKLQKNSDNLQRQPLKCQIAFLLHKATNTFVEANTKQCIHNSLLQIVEHIEGEVKVTPGLLTFHSVVTNLLWELSSGDPAKLYAARIKYHESALTQSKESPLNIDKFEDASHLQNEALARCLLDLSKRFKEEKSYDKALQANQQALEISERILGEKHESTADSYRELGIIQHEMHDYTSALQSHQRALAIRIKLSGEEHESTAKSYRELGITQREMHDYTSALQSHQRALDIRFKLFGEEHESTADSYRELGVTQSNIHDITSALQSHQRALAINIKLFGEEHESTADSYRNLGVTQHKMRDYTSALQSHHRALAIRIKLFGEEHESTADCYRELGVTQNKMHDYTSALQSHQRALAIRIKVFGEEHESTADSYIDLGVTRHKMCDHT